MKCSIGNPNLKTWNRIIHAMSISGDEDIHFAFTDSALTLTVFDASLTVCVTCTFFRNFFLMYNVARGTDLKFKVSVKCFLKPFRSMRFLTKCCDFCEIQFGENSGNIVVTVGCKSGAEIQYTIVLSADGEELGMDYDLDSLKHWLKMEPKLMMGSLSNFVNSKGLVDLTLKAHRNKMLLKNCTTDLVKKEGRMYTELSLNAVDFLEYHVQEDSEVTFQLREFKTFAGFAEHMKLPMTIHFLDSADPIMLTVKSEILESTMLIAPKVVSAIETANSSQNSTSTSNGRISNISSEVLGNNKNTKLIEVQLEVPSSSRKRLPLQVEQAPVSLANDENHSPPRKKLRDLFPNMGKPYDINKAFPGHDVVLAPPSDEEGDN